MLLGAPTNITVSAENMTKLCRVRYRRHEGECLYITNNILVWNIISQLSLRNNKIIEIPILNNIGCFVRFTPVRLAIYLTSKYTTEPLDGIISKVIKLLPKHQNSSVNRRHYCRGISRQVVELYFGSLSIKMYTYIRRNKREANFGGYTTYYQLQMCSHRWQVTDTWIN